MSVLLSKNKKELIVSCNCGCNNGLHIKIEKEDPEYFCYTSYLSGNWYRDQDKKNKMCGMKKNQENYCSYFQ